MSEPLPVVKDTVDANELRHFVTQIKSAEQQVGEHIIRALQSDDTVAVLTTVVAAPDGGQHVVSAGLDPQMMHQVQQLLAEAERKRVKDTPCVGFHCYLRKKDDDDAAS